MKGVHPLPQVWASQHAALVKGGVFQLLCHHRTICTAGPTADAPSGRRQRLLGNVFKRVDRALGVKTQPQQAVFPAGTVQVIGHFGAAIFQVGA